MYQYQILDKRESINTSGSMKYIGIEVPIRGGNLKVKMAMIKNFRIFHKLEPPYSVILENKQYEDSLLFESSALAVLRKNYTLFLSTVQDVSVLFPRKSIYENKPSLRFFL